MDLLFVLTQVLVLSVGILLLVFNKEIGNFLDKHGKYGFKFEEYIPYFPRMNAIIIGLVFLLAALYNLVCNRN